MQALTRVRSSRELLWNLTLRELRTKYRRSVLGWTWSLLNPLATVAIYGYVFGTLFGAVAEVGDPSGIDSFALWMLCALLPWNFFVLVQNIVQFAIEMALLTVVMLIFGSPLLPWLPVTMVLMLLLAVFAAGLSLALASIGVYFRDLPYLWGIVLQVWFFATPIVYSPSLVEGKLSPAVTTLLSYNPMARFAEAFRATMYDGTAPGLTSVLVLAALSFVTLALGWMIFQRLSHRLAEEL
jgi:lipopolysaccharide transport system permease protein